MGSVYGCARGDSTCAKDHNRTDNNTCFAHTSCASCALASHLCHWCAHDNACHVVGSTSGCLRGVNCYDNAHCQRQTPEAIPPPPLRVLPLALGMGIALLICCCSTCCCCAVSCVKGAYNDLVSDIMQASLQRAPPRTSPSVAETVQDAEEEVEEEESTENDAATSSFPHDDNDELEQGNADTTAASHNESQQPLLSDNDTSLLHDRLDATLHRPTRSIHRLYSACLCAYAFSLATAATLAYGTVRYFPQAPAYSVCSDSVAWKSIIDSIVAAGVAAEFELLVSIANPNAVGVALDACHGSFFHDTGYVGNFTIPPTTIAAESISDLLIVATLHPARWLALQLGKEYYRGSLRLNITVDAMVRVPVAMDYRFAAHIQDVTIDVNQEADRHLCACPTWSDARNHSSQPMVELPEFMMDIVM